MPAILQMNSTIKHDVNAENPRTPPGPFKYTIKNLKIKLKTILAKQICLRVKRFGSVIPTNEEPRKTACIASAFGIESKDVMPIKTRVRKEEARTLPKCFVSARACVA